MQYDIVIAGAGPVGLSLALRLKQSGKKVLLIEKNPTTHEHSRAPAIWPRTQEVLAGIGVIDRFLEEGITHDVLKLTRAETGKVLLQIPIHELKGITAYPQFLIIPQSKTESLLCEATKSAGVDVEFSAELMSFNQSEEKVSVQYEKNGEQIHVEAKYLIGCDGAHSKVREELGFHLEGETYSTEAALADVRLKTTKPSPLLSTGEPLVVAIQIDTDLWRLILPFANKSTMPLDERVKKSMSQLFPDTKYEDVWQSSFMLHNRISNKFVDGRVALAGDAAHLNSPVGGQGMNAGIQDTEILAEAIVRAIDNDDPSQLQVYESIRKPAVTSGVNRFTDIMTNIIFVKEGVLLPHIVRVWSVFLKIPFIRRRFLMKLAMFA